MYVIQVAESEGKAADDPVHHSLEAGAPISKNESHPQKLEEPERRYHRHFANVVGVSSRGPGCQGGISNRGQQPSARGHQHQPDGQSSGQQPR